MDLGDDAVDRAGYLRVDLVSRDLEEGFAGGDLVADLLEPVDDRALGDGLAKVGNRDFSHGGGRP